MNFIKKILIFWLLSFSLFSLGLDYSHAETRTVEVIVTENIPWLGCTPEKQFTDSAEGVTLWVTTDSNDATRYVCDVPVWMEWALIVLGKMIRWLTGFAMVCAVLFLVFNGMRLTTGWVDTEAKWKVKSQIMMTLGWIVLLLLSGPILKLIAPWVYR